MLRSCIERIFDPRQESLLKLYEDHKDLFHKNPGSTHIHQNWEGGLADHLVMMFDMALNQYGIIRGLYARYSGGDWERYPPFSLASANVVILLHDAEKVIVYGDKEDPRCKIFIRDLETPHSKVTKESLKWDIINYWQEKYNFQLTDAEINAIKYTHGEGEDYRNDQRVMNELAAFVGNIDRTSARIFYDMGKGLGKELNETT